MGNSFRVFSNFEQHSFLVTYLNKWAKICLMFKIMTHHSIIKLLKTSFSSKKTPNR